MAFLRSYSGVESGPSIEGRGLWLRPPRMSDYAPWAELRAESREHLMPWEPQWARDELSRTAYRRRIKHYQREAAEDQGYAFFIFETDHRLVGGLTFSNLRRGVTQAASLGYWLGRPHIGRGLMTEAVRTASEHAFSILKLHRIEAATKPANVRSIRVLERNAFTREGFARGYLKIDGQWADHVLFARLASDVAGAER
ncbi:MAG: GNAT family N-acetyltransferase [Hyphomicrobium sp.]